MNTKIGDYFQSVQPEQPGHSSNKPQKKRIALLIGRIQGWICGHRVLAAGIAVVMLITAVLPSSLMLLERRQYNLSDATLAVLTPADEVLAKKLVFDQQTGSYVFNREHMPYDIPGSGMNAELADQVSAIRLLQKKMNSERALKVGGNTKKDTQLHSTRLAKSFEQGVTYYDNESQISFSLIPNFEARSGDRVGDRLVYPLTETSGQVVYTIEPNGVKEDIVLPRFTTDKMVFSYTLGIDDTLAARLLENGNIGIFSADPSLFADAVAGESIDAEKILTAQKNASKNKLVFEIPAPIVRDKDGVSIQAISKFELKGKNVDIVTTNLSKAMFPLSIDPTIIVANSANLSTGNNESNATLSNDAVSRTPVTGGIVQGVWPTTSAHATGRKDGGFLSYGTYAYVVGGQTGTSSVTNSVQYAPINSNGTLGTWQTTTSFTTARSAQGTVAYNGFMYVMGGHNGASTVMSDVQYAPINSNGTLGTWQTTTSLPVSRALAGSVAYNGFLYSYGGNSDVAQTSPYSSVHYAPINANGTIGGWSTTSSMTVARASINSSLQYNGYLYAVGGYTGSANLNSVEYAPINADGSVGNWAVTTPLTLAIRNAATVTYGGYLYISGGYTTTDTSRTFAAPIYANGSLGAWSLSNTAPTVLRNGHAAFAYNNYIYISNGRTESGATYHRDVHYTSVLPGGALDFFRATTAAPVFTTTRERMATAMYNGYLYQMGGYGGAGNSYVNFTQYAKIGENGDVPTAGTTTTGITTSRADLSGIAYNGYLYNLGGYNGSTYYTTVQYAAITASTGAIAASWTSGTALPTARAGMGVAAYNNYMYIVGGRSSAGDLSDVRYATINANGSLSAWSSTVSLPTALNRAGVDVYNGYIYVTGGTTVPLPTVNTGATTGTRATGAASSVVYYAKLNSNGTIGTWNTTTAMTSPRAEHGMVAYRGNLYVAGGFHNAVALPTAEYAPINADGTIGTWVTFDLLGGSAGRVSSTLSVYNGYMYLFGGRSDTGTGNNERQSGVAFTEVQNGGSGVINAFTTSASSMPTGKQYAASVHLNGYVYALGGSGTNNYQYAQVGKDGTVGSWTTATLPISVTGATAVTNKGYIYVIGGNNTSVRFAKQNADGSLGSWSTTSVLPVALQYSASVVSEGYVYTVGGAVGTTAQSTVYYSQINQDGSLGVWQTSGNALPAARYSGSLVVQNKTLYYLGGWNASAQRTVYYSEIMSDGSNTPWKTSAAQLPVARMGSVAFGVNGNIYVVAGNTSATVYVTSITTTGDIQDWHTSAAVLPATRTYASGVYANGYIYILGGNSATSVYYAPVNSMPRVAQYSKMIDLGTNSNLRSITKTGMNADGLSMTFRTADNSGIFGVHKTPNNETYDGTLTGWSATTPMALGANGLNAAVIGNYAYVLRNGTLNTYYARINADGSTGSWASTAHVGDGATQYAGFIALNGYLYTIGGWNAPNGTDRVVFAKPNANGTISAWTSTTALPAVSYLGAVRVVNGYIYVASGRTTGNTSVATVYYAKPNADGTISSWATTTSVPTARVWGSSFTAHGNLYLVSGFLAGGGTTNTVIYAKSNADGTLGSWTTSPNLMSVGVRTASTAYIKDYIYVFGGYTSTSDTLVDTVQFAKVNPDGSIGAWSISDKSLPVATFESTSLVINDYIYVLGGNIGGTGTSAVYRTRIQQMLGNITDNTRYVWLHATINDTEWNARFGDDFMGSLTGIAIEYRIVAPPNARLKGGKHFENNILQPHIRPETNN